MCYAMPPERRSSGSRSAAPFSEHELVHAEFELHFQRMLARHAFDIVHINHLLGFPLVAAAFRSRLWSARRADAA